MLTLTPEELRDITGKRRSDAQERVLGCLGVYYRRRPDGTLAVLRSAAEAALGGGGRVVAREPQLQP